MNSVFKAAVIGDPIEHSLSPVIFSYLSQRQNCPISYQRLKISAQDWDLKKGAYLELETLNGWNVTLPLKKKIFSSLNQLSHEAKVLEAVNVVHRLEGSLLKGYNTDVFGIIQTLQERNIRIQDQVIVLWGAGGAASAAAYALGKLKAKEVRICNRTFSHAQTLVEKLQGEFPQTSYLNVSSETDPGGMIQLESESVSVYIHATPIGMKGYPKTLDLFRQMNPQAFAFDLVYSSEMTPFLKAAQAQGLAFVGGLDMLVWQALETWKIWISPFEELAHLKADLMQHLQEHLRVK